MGEEHGVVGKSGGNPGVKMFFTTKNLLCFQYPEPQFFWSSVELIGLLLVDFSLYRHPVFNFLFFAK